MKKVLFITLIAVVFILASCTLAPFAYLFGGGMSSGGGRPEAKDGELVIDFKDIISNEDFKEQIAYFMIFIEGPQNITERRVENDIEEKKYTIKKGNYYVRVYAINDLDKTIGVFKKTIELAGGTKEKLVPIFEETKNLIIRFGDDQIQSRAFSGNINYFEGIVRKQSDNSIINHFFLEYNGSGDQKTQEVSVEVGNTYIVEIYSLKAPEGYNSGYNPSEGSALTDESTLVVAYGMNSVEVLAGPDDPSVTVKLEPYQSETDEKFETVDQQFTISVSVTFPATYTTKRLTNSKNDAEGAVGSPLRSTDFGALLLNYATESSTKPSTININYNNDTACSYNGIDGTLLATITNQTNKFLFEASETVWYWFTATDTNNRSFIFPSDPATVVVESGKTLDVVITE